MKIIILALLFLTSTAFGTVFEDISKLPKVNTAKIRRGTTEIPVDLSDPSAKAKIKDYDVLILDEGVYSTLGNSSAKYVRVIGRGQRKTFISSMVKDSSPILVNSTELWDLTVADAKFKVVDVSGLWAVNVEFVGAVLVTPASLDKSPAFSIRAVFSELAEEGSLITNLKVDSQTPAALLTYEDKLDRNESMNLKERLAHKGLIARGANYLYQMKNQRPQYDQEKYKQLTKQAQAAKAKGHLYVSMLFWAEADRLSGHSRFDEVLKEITPLNQNVSQECGCTVEGQGLATTIKTEIEKNLYAKLPVTSLPGRCKIQTLHVNKGTKISAARLQAQLDQAAMYRAQENNFQATALAHATGAPVEDDFEVGAPAAVSTKEYTAVADVNMPGMKKSYTSDNKSIVQSIIEPLTKSIADKFAAKIKAAKAKIASSDLIARVDGFIAQSLYGDQTRQNEYEELHEQQFGRKLSTSGAMSSVFAY